MARRGALFGTMIALPLLGSAAHAHNLVGCAGFCYDGTDDPQFALQLRHLATGLVTFEVCDINPLSGIGEWNGPCGHALFTGATEAGRLEGDLMLESACGDAIATVTSTCFALKDLLIEGPAPSGMVATSINLMAMPASSCDFLDFAELTLAYQLHEMQTGALHATGHLHVTIGAGLQTVTTEPLDLPVGRPLRMAISSGISATAGFADQSQCIARWTASLPESGPVMNLPRGFTLSSEQGLIIDNRWTPVVPCVEDLDGSGGVDITDLLQLLAGWGSGGPGAAIAEPGDVIDVADLLDLLSMWGPCS